MVIMDRALELTSVMLQEKYQFCLHLEINILKNLIFEINMNFIA